MSQHFPLACAFVSGTMSAPSASPQEIEVTPVSAMERIYPDRLPGPDRIPGARPPVIEDVPRGGRAVFRFAVQPTKRSGTLSFAVTQLTMESGVALAGATLREYGDSVLYTPLFIGEHPLITVSVSRTASGSLTSAALSGG